MLLCCYAKTKTPQLQGGDNDADSSWSFPRFLLLLTLLTFMYYLDELLNLLAPKKPPRQHYLGSVGKKM